MRQNVGMTDRMARGLLAIGAIVGASVLGFASGWGIVLLVVAAVLVVTGLVGYCPAYGVLGIDTSTHGPTSSGGRGLFHTHRIA